MNMSKNVSKKVKTAALATAIAALGAGSAFAYFSGSAASVQNEFHIVAGSKNQKDTAGTINEDEWEITKKTDANGDGIADVEQAQPGQEFAKDPTLTSNVEYGAVAYIRVKVPTVSAQKTGDSASKVYDAFTLGDINSDFTLVSDTTSTTAGTDSVYIYRYDIEMHEAETTPALFEKVTIPEFTELKNGLTDSIDIDAVLIQSEGNATVGTDKKITEASGADSEAKAMFMNIG